MHYAFYERLCVPVTASNRTVVRAALRRLKKPYRRKRQHRTERRKLLRAVLKEHARALRQYIDVMNGTFGRKRRRRRPTTTPAA